MSTAVLSDDEIDDICDGLTQNAAKVRYLQSIGLPVERKPNGRPLVKREDWTARPRQANAARRVVEPTWSTR